MKLAYFPNHCALNSQAPMTAFLHSCRRHGIDLVENSLTADAAVIWSVTWAGKLAANQPIYRHYRQHNRPVIIVEVGALHRGLTWKIAINNITADGYYGHLDCLDWDRPAKLKLQQSSSVVSKPTVLIVAQNSQSQQVESLTSVDQWIVDTVDTIKSHTDRQIVLRPHPRSKIHVTQLPTHVMIETPRKLANSYDSFDINYHHHAVINYNSGAGVQAALMGSAIVVDQSSLAHPVSNTIQNIENLIKLDKSQWLVQIAHTEYLTEEIERGLWIPRLKPMLPL